MRTLGEQLHDETRTLMRRHHIENATRFDEVERRLDIAERRRRDEWDEWRSVMKPPTLGPLMRKLDDLTPDSV